MNISPLRFSSNALIDGGGSGWRLDITGNNGENYPVPGDPFRGAVNVHYSEIQGDITLEKVLGKLIDRFIEKRLSSPRKFTVNQGQARKTISEILAADPFQRAFVSTAGQIQKDSDQGFLKITAAANLPASMQNTDFIGTFRRIFLEKLHAKGMDNLIDKSSFAQKGWMFNDALAGVMALAKNQELQEKSPLTAKSPTVILLDVGSGIATGGIAGNRLFTAESQNTQIWYNTQMEQLRQQIKRAGEQLSRGLTALKGGASSANAQSPTEMQDNLRHLMSIAAMNPGKTFEDYGSLRGMTIQTVFQLKLLPAAQRAQNPVYQAMRATALAKDAALSTRKQQFAGAPEAFDRHFENTNLGPLQTSAWKNRWINEHKLIVRYLENTHDPIAAPVMDGVYDALAALGATKIMEHVARKVYVQFIDLDNALREVNATRKAKSLPALKNPLVKEVSTRMWDKYLNTDIAKTCFDRKNGVVRVDLRNMEGTGYLSEAMKPDRDNKWQIQGVHAEDLQHLV